MKAFYLVTTWDESSSFVTIGVDGQVFTVNRKYVIHATQVVALVAWIASMLHGEWDTTPNIIDIMDAAEALL